MHVYEVLGEGTQRTGFLSSILDPAAGLPKPSWNS